MNRTMKMIAVALLPLMLAACVQPEDKNSNNGQNNGENNGECFAGCEQEEEHEQTKPRPALDGVFVSGHLGSYRDCPEDGYTGNAPGADPDSAPAEGDFAEGACAEGTECTPILNCEQAQLTLQLTNNDDEDATEILVDTIELLNKDDSVVATLPLIGLELVASGASTTFDGNLAAGETITLRVDLQGPTSPWELLAVDGADTDRGFSGDAGFLRVTLSSDDREDTIVTSTELYAIPSVDT